MKIIQQDMTKLRSGIIFHQVNCQGVMGGGIAAAFARKWPGLEKAYRETIAERVNKAKQDPEFIISYLTEDGDILCESGLANDVMLGRVFLYEVPEHAGGLCKIPPKTLYIANVFGQGDYSSICRMTSYDATVRAFENIVDKPPFNGGLTLYFPYKMGCGLGGGDWKIYSAIIERYFPDAIICQL